MKNTRHKQDQPSGGVNGTLPGGGDQRHGVYQDWPLESVNSRVCEVCLKPLGAGRGGAKRFCSSRCRLLSWAVDALARALKEGKAEGLRAKVNDISGGLKVEVVHSLDGRLPS